MVKNLFKFLWKYFDLILYILGLAAITTGLFLWNEIIGFVGAGISFILTAYLIDLVPRQGNGGD